MSAVVVRSAIEPMVCTHTISNTAAKASATSMTENVFHPPTAPNRSDHTSMYQAMHRPNVATSTGLGVTSARRCRHKTMLETDPTMGTTMRSGFRYTVVTTPFCTSSVASAHRSATVRKAGDHRMGTSPAPW